MPTEASCKSCLWGPALSFLPTRSQVIPVDTGKSMCPHHDTCLAFRCPTFRLLPHLDSGTTQLAEPNPAVWVHLSPGLVGLGKKVLRRTYPSCGQWCCCSFLTSLASFPANLFWHSTSGPALHTRSLPATLSQSSFCPLSNHPVKNMSGLFRLGWEMDSLLGQSHRIKISKSLLIKLSWDQSPEWLYFLFFICWFPWLVPTLMWNCWLILGIHTLLIHLLFILTSSLVGATADLLV